MIDKDGFKTNIGIIIHNKKNMILLAHSTQYNVWQFPQGTVDSNETVKHTLYRELMEEIDLWPEHVDLLGATSGWLHYRFPKNYSCLPNGHLYIGQKQRWFLLRLSGKDNDIKFNVDDKPEFDNWCWVDYWK